MVRKVSISPEYPCEPDGDAAILDDEFRFADAIPPQEVLASKKRCFATAQLGWHRR